MQIVPCPACTLELDLDSADAGHLVECPVCLHQFTHGTMISVEAPLVLAMAMAIATPRPLEAEPDTRDRVPIRCRVCQGHFDIFQHMLGTRITCPLCREPFLAESRAAAATMTDDARTKRARFIGEDADENDDKRRRNRRREQAVLDEYNPKRLVRNAKSELASPASALTSLGWIDVVAGVISLIIGGISLAYLLQGTLSPTMSWMIYWNIFPGIGGVLLGALKVYGGLAMKNLNNRSLAVLGCAAGLAPLNIGACVSVLLVPAFVVSVVFSSMGLLSLRRERIKKAFEYNKPGGDVDAA